MMQINNIRPRQGYLESKKPWEGRTHFGFKQDRFEPQSVLTFQGNKGPKRERILTNLEHPDTTEPYRVSLTTTVFRTPVCYGKLPNFLRTHPQFKTIEIPAASCGQTALGLALVLAATMNKSIAEYKIIATDKFCPEQLQMAQEGIVSSQDVGNSLNITQVKNEDQTPFEKLTNVWQKMLSFDLPARQIPPLNQFVNSKPLDSQQYENYLVRNSSSRYSPSVAGTRWEQEEQIEELFQLKPYYQQLLKQLLHFETEKKVDLIDQIEKNPYQIPGPRLIFIQNAVYLLSPKEREGLIKALAKLPEGSTVVFGASEFTNTVFAERKPWPYQAQDFLQHLEEAGFKPVGGKAFPDELYRDGAWSKNLTSCEFPGAYIKQSAQK